MIILAGHSAFANSGFTRSRLLSQSWAGIKSQYRNEIKSNFLNSIYIIKRIVFSFIPSLYWKFWRMVTHRPFRRFWKLTLSLFVLRVLADDPDAALSLNDLALLTDRFYWWSNLHLVNPPFTICSLLLELLGKKRHRESVSPKARLPVYHWFLENASSFFTVFQDFILFYLPVFTINAALDFRIPCGVHFLFGNCSEPSKIS